MMAGILNNRTGFNEVKSDRIRKGREGYEIVIVPENESAVNRDIVVTQKDVEQIVKAKASIRAAVAILLEYSGLKESEIDRILLAGSFGSYIDPRSARTIGLLPDVDLERIVQIGNAAGSGAKLALLNADERLVAERISALAVYVELATQPRFFKEYVNSLYLPHRMLEKYPKTVKLLTRT